MRKIFTFITALTVGAMINVWAGVFKLAGEEILGSVDLPDLATTLDAKENVTASGTISFEAATQTLTLENATIECTNFFDVLMLSDAYDLTINLIGTNTLSQPQTTSGTYFSAIAFYDDNANLTITGSGKLILNSYKNWPINLQKGSLTITNTTIETYSENPENEKGIGNETKDAGSLVIENSLVKTNKIYNLNAITLTNSSILYPSGESQSVGDCTTGGSSGKAVIKYDGTPASNVVIFPNEITVGEVLYKSHSLSYGNRQFYVSKQAYANSSLTIPDSITYEGFKFQVHHIYTEAFQNNTSITSVDLGCVEIWGNAFQNCTNLETVTLREGIKSIGGFVFSNIKATSLALPSTLNDFPNSGSPFENNKFTEITFPNGNANFVIGDDGALYNKAKTKLIAFPYAYSKKFSEIPATVTIITMNAFSNCTNIADTLEIPAALNNANYAFHNTNIKCVIFNSNSTYLSNVFQGTAAIEEVIIGPNVTHLGELIFYRCSGIKKVVVLSKTKPVWDTENVFGDAGTFPPFATAKVYVHCGQSGDYTADANKWAKFTNIVDTLLYDVNVEAANADVVITKLAECSKVNIAVTPNSGYAFVNWDNGVETASFDCIVTSDTTITANIKKVLAVGETFTANTVEGVTVTYKVLTKEAGNMTVQVGEKNGFVGNTGQAISKSYTGAVTIPETVNYFDEAYTVVALGASAFNHCSLTSLSLPNTVQKLDQNSIYECTSLTSVNIPEGITVIPRYNLSYMHALTSLTLPTTLQYIYSGVFNYNENMATLENWNPSQYVRIGNNIGAMNTKFFNENCVVENGLKYAGDILLDRVSYLATDTLVVKEGTRLIPYMGTNPNVKTIVFPSTLVAIGDDALYNYPILESCTLNVTLPPVVYRARDSQDLTVETTVDQILTGTTPKDIKVYVPKAALDTFKNDVHWSVLTDFRPIEGWEITFIDGNGNQIGEKQHLDKFQIPTLPATTPVKDQTVEWVYTFNNKWLISSGDTVVAGQTVRKDEVYVALFDSVPRPYKITFKNYDGTEVWSDNIGYGQAITYGGAVPTRDADAQYTYTFNAWDNGFVDGTTTVTGEMTFTATYNTTIQKYTVKFYPDAVEAGDESSNFYVNKKVNYGTSLATIAAEAMADPTFSIPECYKLLGWTVDGINLYPSETVIEKVLLFPLWNTNATFTVTFINKLGGATVDYFDDVECYQEATAPASPTPGYKWQWDSDEWKSVTKDLVIEGILVEEGGTGIINTSAGAAAQKVMIDGHLFILCGEHLYDAQGQIIR